MPSDEEEDTTVYNVVVNHKSNIPFGLNTRQTLLEPLLASEHQSDRSVTCSVRIFRG